MKEFFHDIYLQPFVDGDIFGIIMSTIMWFVSLIVAMAILYFTAWLIDSSFMPERKGQGYVTAKYEVPESTSTYVVMSGKTMIPISTHRNRSYTLEITIDHRSEDINVPYDWYEKLDVGSKVQCTYNTGRLFKSSLYIRSLISKK